MSRFNTSQNHPLIPNSQYYESSVKHVTIYSQDINRSKFPSASNFEIELPQDYTNVQSVKLISYVFPSNFYTFSYYYNNIFLSFKINKPFNPGEYNISNTLLEAIFRALYANIENEYIAVITEGYYTQQQMANELTNQMNTTVTNYISSYMKNDPVAIANNDLSTFLSNGGYTQFIIVYNQVSQKFTFGNKSSGFILTNNSPVYSNTSQVASITNCITPKLNSFLEYGLPAYLGFFQCNVESLAVPTYPSIELPRLTYIVEEPLATPPVTGYWLVPDPEYVSPDNINFPTYVYTIQAPSKTNLSGPTDILMSIQELNNIDETIPYQNNEYTRTTNVTNGIVNSCYAKIQITSQPPSTLYTLYSEGNFPIRVFDPPIERIRRLSIKFQFHNGVLVPFDNSSFSFTLEFCMFKPVIYRTLNVKEPSQPVIPTSFFT